LIVELPDHRYVALQPLQNVEEDSLVDELLTTSSAFQTLVAKSKASPRQPFVRVAVE
jgi:hypothetical protein